MPDEIYRSSPESTDSNALKIAVLTLQHPIAGLVKVPYGAIVDYPSYVAAVIGSTVGANKNHVSFWNDTNRRIRIRKIELSSNITGTVAGATIMVSAEGLTTPKPSGGTSITPRKLSTNAEDLPTGLEILSAPTTNVNIVANYVLSIVPLHIEEAVTTVGDKIDLFKKDTEISSIQLETGQGIIVKQGSLAGAGAFNILFYFTLD